MSDAEFYGCTWGLTDDGDSITLTMPAHPSTNFFYRTTRARAESGYVSVRIPSLSPSPTETLIQGKIRWDFALGESRKGKPRLHIEETRLVLEFETLEYELNEDSPVLDEELFILKRHLEEMKRDKPGVWYLKDITIHRPDGITHDDAAGREYLDSEFSMACSKGDKLKTFWLHVPDSNPVPSPTIPTVSNRSNEQPEIGGLGGSEMTGHNSEMWYLG